MVSLLSSCVSFKSRRLWSRADFFCSKDRLVRREVISASCAEISMRETSTSSAAFLAFSKILTLTGTVWVEGIELVGKLCDFACIVSADKDRTTATTNFNIDCFRIVCILTCYQEFAISGR